jgi:copper transport protein
MGRALALLGVVVATLGLSGGTVLAHVEVVRTIPADGSVLNDAPSNITVSFTDELSLDLASAELRTASGTRIELGPLTFGGDHRQLVVTFPPLVEDAYRLSYDVRDPVDLHETSGSLVFGVGTTPIIGGGTSSQGAKPADSAFGWIARGGLALVIGGVAVILLVRLRPQHWVERNRFIVTSVAVVRCGAAAVVVGEMASLASQVLDIGGSLFATTWRVLLRSSYGHRFLITAVLVLGLFRFLAIVRRLLVRTDESAFGIAEAGLVIFAAGLLAVASFASHAAIGGGFVVGVLLRVGHLGGMGVWVGGLVVLVVARRRFGSAGCAGVLRSFSPIASLAVAVTVATGLLLAGREVTSPTALLSTGFGTVLIVKLILLGLALVLGARHASAARRGRPLRSLALAVEVALAVTVVLGGAALATAAPAVGERFAPADEVLPTNASAKVDDLLVRLTIGPSRPGRNLVRVELIDSRKPAPAAAESVTVTMTNASGEVVSRSDGPPVDGIIDFDPADVTSPGPLRAVVQVDRSSRPVLPVTFDWIIGPTGTPRAKTLVSDRSIEPLTTAAAAGVVVLAGTTQLLRRRRKHAAIGHSAQSGSGRFSIRRGHGTMQHVEVKPFGFPSTGQVHSNGTDHN